MQDNAHRQGQLQSINPTPAPHPPVQQPQALPPDLNLENRTQKQPRIQMKTRVTGENGPYKREERRNGTGGVFGKALP